MAISWVHRHILDGKTYIGFLPESKPVFTDPAPSIVRRVGSDGPVIDIHSNDITCNFNARPIADSGVSRTGSVTAGSKITFYWQGWPHSGPIVTYMSRCSPNCGSFLGNESASWFKIDEFGYQTPAGGSVALWGTQQLDTQKYYWNVTVPACLEASEYLVRHEIIALSDCKQKGKCQFYPSCAQVKVTGGGSVKPSGSALVSFPGAYTDASVYWDTNTMDPKGYVIPGPKVWKCPA
ncbi:glycoside hydrolase [Byssothecium circinans]|uniref:lytic cellulose monooxygenase (C4-dehydrogenating) n=1 Tax=Byssothecium circinans TaxID=147558 RepID=A0A6A5TS63_9PLEO|nr:glycoside hydrolase [Byssothecium circinans]